MHGFTGGSGGSDIHGYWQKAQMPAGTMHYYQAGNLTCSTYTNVTPTAGKLYAFPIFFPTDTTVLNMHIGVAGARAGSLARLGIYDSISGMTGPAGANTYPNNLLYDSGDIDTSALGMKTVVPNYAFTKNVLYYLTSLFFNGGAGVAVINGVQSPCNWAVLGDTTDASGSQKNCWQATFAYAALPATFPTAGSTALFVDAPPAPLFSFV